MTVSVQTTMSKPLCPNHPYMTQTLQEDLVGCCITTFRTSTHLCTQHLPILTYKSTHAINTLSYNCFSLAMRVPG